MSGVEDSEAGGRSYGAPYTSHHPVPSIQKYKDEKQQREGHSGRGDRDEGPSRTERAKGALQHYKGNEGSPPSDPSQQSYPTVNKNVSSEAGGGDEGKPEAQEPADREDTRGEENENEPHDTSEVGTTPQDAKEKRKQMKNREKHSDGTEREVTDPVTHLPVKVKDFTGEDLKKTPENVPPRDTETRTGAGDDEDGGYKNDKDELDDAHASLQKLFPPPNFEMIKRDLQDVHSKSMFAGLSVISVSLLLSCVVVGRLGAFEVLRGPVAILVFVVSSLLIAGGTIWAVQTWSRNKINDVWENHVWEAERQQGIEASRSQTAESTQWLNSLLGSVWPLINPDLFTSLADTLEVSSPPLSKPHIPRAHSRRPRSTSCDIRALYIHLD